MNWSVWALLGLLLAFGISAPFMANRLRQYRLSRAGLGDISLMTDDAMRLHMARLFGAMGYRVFRTDPEKDGFDLVLLDGLGQKRGVLLGQWRRPVDEKVVARAAGAAQTLGGAASMIVTVAYYTYKARAEAEATGTILWSLGDVTRAIGLIRQAADDRALPTPVPQASPEQLALDILMEPAATGEPARWQTLFNERSAPKCPRCGKKMVIKRNSKSSYWGCRAFPRCLGTLARVADDRIRP